MADRTSELTIGQAYKVMVLLCFGVVVLLLITAFVLGTFFSENQSVRIDLVLNTVLDTLKVCVGLFFGLLGGKAVP